ncbi:DUF368 domain-containing protein [candidate division FCPU426 bacterium]|nr:DUF368 domain-containing protein [candidate division FCPU426 bacterium]
MSFVKNILQGMVIGVANIIPGVSGGTMALVLGIYERLIAAIHNFSWKTVLACLGLFKFNAKAREEFLQEMRRIDAWFLASIGVGAVAAIIALAKVMTYFLEKHHDVTYGFFFGLVAISILVPLTLIKKHTWVGLLIGLLAAGSVVALANTMSEGALLEKARAKYELKVKKELGLLSKSAEQKVQYAPQHLLFLFGAGTLAISAMILPGISGSFLLLLLGAYFEILKAIAYLDLVVLAVFAAGCGIGLLLFTRFLDYLLKHWHNLTMYFLVGLVAGSLWPIWPFKQMTRVGDEVVYLANKLPAAFGVHELLVLLASLLGGMLVLLFMVIEKKPGTAAGTVEA